MLVVIHSFKTKFTGESADKADIVERVHGEYERLAPHLNFVCESLARKSKCSGVLLPFVELTTYRFKCSVMSYIIYRG